MQSLRSRDWWTLLVGHVGADQGTHVLCVRLLAFSVTAWAPTLPITRPLANPLAPQWIIPYRALQRIFFNRHRDSAPTTTANNQAIPAAPVSEESSTSVAPFATFTSYASFSCPPVCKANIRQPPQDPSQKPVYRNRPRRVARPRRHALQTPTRSARVLPRVTQSLICIWRMCFWRSCSAGMR